ncbi:DUF971 domain-containing protein [Burkholderia cepacia]|uniref:DUF971 domain-containing protein n=1 Tax=Burkholderia cepacia TaxID=292 RepID=UPI002AB768F9|nr:DUF971 domain-containing protein [Burkholderia cepacia]
MRTPQRIELDGETRTLTLHWPQGLTQRLSHRALREACPCAQCRRLRVDGGTLSAPPGIAVLEVRPAGYGLQLLFSDQHERGIFPFDYIARLSASTPAPGRPDKTE